MLRLVGTKEKHALKLTIALQEGFDRDEVEVHVGGQSVFKKTNLSTRLQLGLAESFEVETSEPVAVDVVVSSRGVRGTHTVDPATTSHLGVSLDQGQLRFAGRREPFGYV